MQRFYLIVVTLAVSVMGLVAQENKTDEAYREELMSRLFVLLSKEHVVSGQMSKSGPKIWVNAKMGQVAYPTGKQQGAGVRYESEWIPEDNGLVVNFSGPFDPRESQKRWVDIHDKAARRFEFLIGCGNGKVIGVYGSYGPSFPAKTVEAIIAMGRT